MKFVLTNEISSGVPGVKEKSDGIGAIRNLVTEFLSNKDYGPGVVEFHLVLKMLLPEHAAMWLGGQFYRPRRKEVLFNPTLDLDQILKTSEREWHQIICNEILKAVLRFPEVKVKQFDHIAMYRDLEALFQEKELLG